MKNDTIYKYLLSGCFILLNMLSCIGDHTSKNVNDNIVYESRNKKIHLEEIIDSTSFKFIRLETKQNILIGSMDKVLFDNNYIFILDKRIARTVFIFDMNGKFISKIDKKGKGPGEYARIEDIDIDTEKKQVILYDLGSRKLIYYSYEGKYLKEDPLKGYRGMQFTYLGNNKFAFHIHCANITKNNDEILITKSNGDIFSKWIPRVGITEAETQYGGDNFFSSTTTGKFFIPTWSDRLFKISKKGITEVFNLNIKNHMLTPEEIQGYTDQKQIKKFENIFKLIVTDDSIFTCKVAYVKNIITIFCDMKTKKIIAGNEIFDAYKSGIQLYVSTSDPIGSYKTYFVTTVASSFIKEHYNYQFKEVKEDDNPFLLLYKLKDLTEL